MSRSTSATLIPSPESGEPMVQPDVACGLALEDRSIPGGAIALCAGRDRWFADLYGAFPVKRLFRVVLKFFVRSGEGRFSSRRLQSGSRRDDGQEMGLSSNLPCLLAPVINLRDDPRGAGQWGTSSWPQTSHEGGTVKARPYRCSAALQARQTRNTMLLCIGATVALRASARARSRAAAPAPPTFPSETRTGGPR
jgi:hypothetical protein